VKAAFVLLLDNSLASLSLATRAIYEIHNYFNNVHHYPLVVFHEAGFPPPHAEQLDREHDGEVFFELVDLSIVHNVVVEDIPTRIPGFSARTTSIGYRSMCRFYSGEIFMHPSLASYEYIWRIDSDAQYICPIEYDIFEFMKENEIIYGWTISMYEEPRISADTLWQATLDYIKLRKIFPTDLDAISNIYGGYDRCHYWNNFEIVDLKFFRSEVYQDYFNYLDESGGFYLYRWGDALVRTVALHLLGNPKRIHFFDDVGYLHQGICRNPCKAKIQCKDQVEPYSGYCGIHAKLCTVENHSWLVFAIIGILLLLGTIWVALCFKKRRLYFDWFKGQLKGLDFRIKDT